MSPQTIFSERENEVILTLLIFGTGVIVILMIAFFSLGKSTVNQIADQPTRVPQPTTNLSTNTPNSPTLTPAATRTFREEIIDEERQLAEEYDQAVT